MMKQWLAVFGFCLLVISGCSRSAGRQSLEGTVTVDGVPVAEGSILFVPQAGTKSPTCGGTISQGKFSIAPAGGAACGTFRVEITALRNTGRKEKFFRMGNELIRDEREQYIPAQYNSQSELSATVSEQSPNQFQFELKSK